MAQVHPRWRNVDLTTQSRELQRHLDTKDLTLLHAEANIIWSDHATVYRLSPHPNQGRCSTHLRAVRALLRTDPTFPTTIPTQDNVRTVALPSSGTWTLTTWNYIPLTPADHHSNESYHRLGQLLRRVHTARIPNLAQHDPLQWARGQIDTLTPSHDVTRLREQLQDLSAQRTAAFPTTDNVTIHADVHWHQVAIDPDGQMLLLDFENISVGHPSDDLEPSAGWIRRTGQPNDEQRQALRSGYGEPWPEHTPEQATVSEAIAKFELHTWHQARLNHAR